VTDHVKMLIVWLFLLFVWDLKQQADINLLKVHVEALEDAYE